MDQKAPYYPPVLHLLPQTACYLALEGIDLRGVVLSVTTMDDFPLWCVS